MRQAPFADGFHVAILSEFEGLLGLWLPADEDEANAVAAALREVLGLEREEA